MSNDSQIEFWNGDAGERWVEAQTYMDALLEPLSEQAIAAAAPTAGAKILDIGCGCGGTSLTLAREAASVTGVDVSAPMLAHARSRVAEHDNIEFIEADASTWRGPSPFDLAFSRFGVMFFDDPTAAFRNIRANLSDQGRLCFLCWRTPQDNPWISVPGAAVQPFLPEAPPPDGPNPFAFADTSFVSEILTEAGFTQPEFALCEATLRLGETIEETLGFLTRIGPLSRVITELDEPTREQALAAARTALEPAKRDRGLDLGASAWIVTARVT